MAKRGRKPGGTKKETQAAVPVPQEEWVVKEAGFYFVYVKQRDGIHQPGTEDTSLRGLCPNLDPVRWAQIPIAAQGYWQQLKERLAQQQAMQAAQADVGKQEQKPESSGDRAANPNGKPPAEETETEKPEFSVVEGGDA